MPLKSASIFGLAAAVISTSIHVGLAAASPRVLIYSATADFRHDSIPTAVEALQNASSALGVQFDHTEDKTRFTDDGLAQYDALLFLMNTGEVLDESGKDALQKYLDIGGNYVGIHAASDALRNTTFYGEEVGAFFDYHPEIQNGTFDVIGPSHPATEDLPAQWSFEEEFYNFKSDPRAVGAVVILSADDSSFTDTGTRKDQGSPHPSAWFQERGAGVEAGGTAGRSFYTSLGHLNSTWHDATFMGHVKGGISWALASNTTRAFNASAQVGSASAQSASASASPSASASGSNTATGSGAAATSGAVRMTVGLGAASAAALCAWTLANI